MKYNNLNLIELKNRKNKWQAVCDYKDTDGKRKLKRKTLPTDSKREAKRLAEEWFNEINNQAEQEAVHEEDTVEEVVLRYLEEQREKHLIEESTYTNQKKRVKAYISPYPIASLGFYSVERSDVEEWISQQFNKSLVSSTIRGSFVILNKVYNEYLRTDRIDKNPCSAVRKPAEKPRKTYMTDEQMTNFLQAVYLEFDNAEKRHLLIAYLLAYYCALRRGELCAVRWRDIDFERGTLTVSSAAGIREGGQYLKDPKNRSSIRTFNIPPQMLEVLENRRKEVNPKDSDFVCSKDPSKPLNTTMAGVAFHNLAHDYDLLDAYGKYITLHSLRHNLGYSGVRSGMDIGALSRVMGHSSQSITLNVYSDTSPDAVKVGMEKLSNFFKKRDLDE